MENIKLMKNYTLGDGYYRTVKHAEIGWQEQIEKLLQENGLDLCWWQLLGYNHNLFMDFVEIYELQDKDDYNMAFMNAYINYVKALIEKVNTLIKARLQEDK